MATSGSTSSSAAPTSILPDFHLLCIQEEASDAFKTAVQTFFPNIESYTNITHHDCSLKHLDKGLRFSTVVSPANSYARLDGAFDDALARAYGRGDYDWITRKAQAVLYEKWRGYAPPGTCTVVRLDHDTPGDAAEMNPWGSEYLLLCPTMRIPWEVTWDREFVYECVWSLLCAVDLHNRKVREAGAGAIESEIKSILMTPLATGCGRISNTQWAEQCVIGMKHWVEAVEKPEIWGCMTWADVLESGRHDELCQTWGGEDDPAATRSIF